MSLEIEQILQDALASSPPTSLSVDNRDRITRIMKSIASGKNKAVLTVLMTLCVKKIESPEQDIRYHQSSMQGGFSGRGLDAKFVTPFLQQNDFPAMTSGSGWLTRSFEHAVPYDFNYTGAITPKQLKQDFLYLVDQMETNADLAKDFLNQLFAELKVIREKSQSLSLSRPKGRSIVDVVGFVKSLWQQNLQGASRIPVIAVYAAYQCLVKEVGRYKHYELQDLLPHTAADEKTHRTGDIDLVVDSRPKEAVEIKHGIAITPGLVEAAIEKVKRTSVERYYILSTNERMDEIEKISELMIEAQQNHGCEFIVNGVAPTLKYYLRLVSNTNDFVDNFVAILEKDTDVSYELKTTWDDITKGSK